MDLSDETDKHHKTPGNSVMPSVVGCRNQSAGGHGSGVPTCGDKNLKKTVSHNISNPVMFVPRAKFCINPEYYNLNAISPEGTIVIATKAPGLIP